ncbi:helix-turn-helix transcriptional regulator [Occultella glacieicola]|uniref:Helix-turn-helix transcriptional regulator n=1 Tax=Occultella glacieicola TaxID=2518684 RepID=A0ABY2E296_9MICO|nr:helix-turn-helix transcriptional regulator [Occultella glacieicola]TDE91636.1 helix-turn-helix transcriptional regulator [Occultella glacieicola]
MAAAVEPWGGYSSVATDSTRDKISDVARVGSEIALVARTGELTRLREIWAQATDGSASAVLLPGDAGVGKTRLVAEFASEVRADGAHVLTGHCVGLGESAPPYLPVVEILEQIRDADPAILDERPALASLVSRSGADRPTEQLPLFDSFLGVLTELCADRPVLLVVEDLHWSDPSTRDLITFLVARMSEQRLAVVLTYRSDDLHRRHPVRPMTVELGRMRRVERLELEPFSPEDARAFARALAVLDHLGADGDEDLIADIARRSEGNAFFAEELLSSARSTTSLGEALADVLLGRIERLTPNAQRLVRTASVSGQRRIRHSTLRAVLEMTDDELEAALRDCVQLHVLVADPDGGASYEFRHALLREAAYADLLPGERTRIHATYAKLLADLRLPGWRGAQAYHANLANDLPTALSAHVGAADEAAQVGATADTLAHLESALGLWQAVADPAAVCGTDELDLTIRASDAAVAAGQVDRALAFARAALKLADADGAIVPRASVRRRLAKILYSVDQWVEAASVIGDAWELIKDEPTSSERAWVLSTLAFGRLEESTREFADAAISDARASGDGGAEADALTTLAYSLLRDGEIDDALATLEEARRRAADVGAFEVELRAIFNLTVGEFELGDLEAAAAHLDRGLARAAETGLTWATYGRELAWIAVHVNYARGAWDLVEQLASPPGEQAPDWISGVLAASAALLAASRGEWEQVEAALNRVETWVLSDDEPLKISLFARAERDLWQHRPAEVTAPVQAAIAGNTRNAMGTTADLERPESDEPEDDAPMLALIHVAAVGITAQADLAARARQVRDRAAEREAVTTGDHFLAVAEDAAARGVPRAATLGPEGLAWLARCRAEASRMRGESDPAPWHAVVDAFGYGDRYQVAIARWRLADVLLALRADRRGDDGGPEPDRDDGRDQLLEALATARSLRARPLEEALLASARRYRVEVPGQRTAAVALLTPREQSVLELVAQGLTNRAVGAELFISEKTVSVHLSRVMAKLDVGSRTEAVAVAMSRGILGGGSRG